MKQATKNSSNELNYKLALTEDGNGGNVIDKPFLLSFPGASSSVGTASAEPGMRLISELFSLRCNTFGFVCLLVNGSSTTFPFLSLHSSYKI